MSAVEEIKSESAVEQIKTEYAVVPAPEDKDVEMDSPKDAKANGEGKSTTQASTDADEELQTKALKQIEFYFADSNLPYDRFMWTLHTANPEHWVPISTVASFKRMRQFQDKGIPWIVEALRKSISLLEVDETNTKVRRREELKEPKDQFERSVYAKGFGDETPTMQEDLEEFFGRYGKVNAVRMRRMEDTKKFKGSAFCEYANFDDVANFLNADPKPQWKGTEVLTMSKDAYCEMKIKEKGLTGKAAIYHKSGGPPGKGFNAFNQKEKDKGKGKAKLSEPQEKPEIFLEFMGTRLKVNEENGGSVVEEDIPFTKGTTLKFSGCGGDVKYAEVKTPLKDRFEKPPFIKYTRGDDWGLVGFDKPLSEEDIAFVRQNLKTVNGNEVTWELADEASEKAFQIERAQSAAQRIVSSGAANGSGRGGRGGRGGRSGRGGRDSRGGRGGKGGRGGGRGGDGREVKESETAPQGEKRKRPVEPDGGPDTKGQGVPIVHTAKKPKVDEKR